MPLHEFYQREKIRLNDATKLVLVEGQDDAHLISHLLHDLQANPQIVGIVDVDGTPNFPAEIEQLLLSHAITSHKITHLAIAFDADEDPSGLYKRIRSQFATHGMQLPPLGEVAKISNFLSGGVFSFPGVNAQGDLELFCLTTVSQNELWQLSQNHLDSAIQLAKMNGRKLKGSIYKRQAQAYLCAHPDDLLRGAGRAFAKGYFNEHHPSVLALKSFLVSSLALAETI